MRDICVHGVWKKAEEECICQEGWSTSTNQDALAPVHVWCNSSARILMPDKSAGGNYLKRFLSGDSSIMMVSLMFLAGFLVIVGILCCCRCLLKRRNKNQQTAPQPQEPQLQRPAPVYFAPSTQEDVYFPTNTYADPHGNVMVHDNNISYVSASPYGNCGAPADGGPGHMLHTSAGYDAVAYNVPSAGPVFGVSERNMNYQ